MDTKARLKDHLRLMCFFYQPSELYGNSSMELLYKLGAKHGFSRAECWNQLVSEEIPVVHIPENNYERSVFLNDFLVVLLAQQKLDDEKELLVKHYAQELGFGIENVQYIINFLKTNGFQKEITQEDIATLITQLDYHYPNL